MRRSSFLVALVLVVAACAPADSDTTSTTSASIATSTAPTPSSDPSPSTTLAGPTTTAEMIPAGAEFVISTVTFGAGPMVVITNIGGETGNLAGHFLCQRPNYWAFPDIEVPAGRSVAVSAGGNVFIPPPGALIIEQQAGIGGLAAGSGEVALYDSNSFGSSDSILSYVEWGNSGHARGSMAIEAGIWPPGGFVPTTTDTVTIIANTLPATDPADWDPF